MSSFEAYYPKLDMSGIIAKQHLGFVSCLCFLVNIALEWKPFQEGGGKKTSFVLSAVFNSVLSVFQLGTEKLFWFIDDEFECHWPHPFLAYREKLLF